MTHSATELLDRDDRPFIPARGAIDHDGDFLYDEARALKRSALTSDLVREDERLLDHARQVAQLEMDRADRHAAMPRGLLRSHLDHTHGDRKLMHKLRDECGG